MSLELIRSNRLEIKTYPAWVSGDNFALRIGRPEQDNLYFSLQRGLDEIDYTLHELALNRRHDEVAISGFKRYLASMKPQAGEGMFSATESFHPDSSFAGYRIPLLSDKTDTDWCGVLIDPTDFLHAAGYVVTNTPVEPNDIRTVFLERL